MVKLSSIRTADELMLALIRQGWSKTVDGNPAAECPSGPFFSFHEWFHPTLEQRGQQITVYPQVLDHGTDLGYVAGVDDNGRLIDWVMFESYGGTIQAIDSDTIELHQFSMGERLDDWQRSWELS